MRVFLIGFMGSGKTTVGKRLAVSSGLAFLDLDQQVEIKYHFSVPHIFEQFGEEVFRKLEGSCLSHLDSLDELVVATGGGTPCFGDNLSRMKKMGPTVYLKVPLDVLAGRLEQSRINRPLLAGLQGGEVMERVATLMQQREAWYEQADYVVETGNLPVFELARQVAHRLSIPLNEFPVRKEQP